MSRLRYGCSQYSFGQQSNSFGQEPYFDWNGSLTSPVLNCGGYRIT